MRATLIFCAGLAFGACTNAGPELDAVTPTAGAVGTTVAIRGARLCGTRTVTASGACAPLPEGLVSFGIDPQIDGEVTGWSDTEIDAVVPPGVSGDIEIVATVDGLSSNGVSFQVR